MKNLTRRALLVGGAAAVLGGALFKFLGNGGAKLKAFLASPKISGMPTKQVAGVLIDWLFGLIKNDVTITSTCLLFRLIWATTGRIQNELVHMKHSLA
jgi:hypothetical protein